MLCPNCSKLAILYTNKRCLHCQSIVLQNISVICESCSTKNKKCSACLKNINNSQNTKHYYGGCGSCRR